MYIPGLNVAIKDGEMYINNEVCVFPTRNGDVAIIDMEGLRCFNNVCEKTIICKNWPYAHGTGISTRRPDVSTVKPDRIIFIGEYGGMLYLYSKRYAPWGEADWEYWLGNPSYQPSIFPLDSGSWQICVVRDWGTTNWRLHSFTRWGDVTGDMYIKTIHPDGYANWSALCCEGACKGNLRGEEHNRLYIVFPVYTFIEFWGVTIKYRKYAWSLIVIDEQISTKRVIHDSGYHGRIDEVVNGEDNEIAFVSTSYYRRQWIDGTSMFRYDVYLQTIKWNGADYDISILYSYSVLNYSGYNPPFSMKWSSLLYDPYHSNWIVTYHDDSHRGWIKCFDPGVGLLWTKDSGNVFKHCSYEGGGILYVADGKLYSIDPLTGDTEWEVDPPAGTFCSAPVNGGVNHIYIGTESPNRILKYDSLGNLLKSVDVNHIPENMTMGVQGSEYDDIIFRDGNYICKLPME